MSIFRRFLRSGGLLSAGFLALSFFIASAVIFSVQQQTSGAVVRRALTIEIELANVFSGLQDAEIGQRGFLLSGNDAFLAPYLSATSRIPMQLAALEQTIAGIDELATPFAELKELATEKLAELAQTIALAHTGRHDEALTIFRNGIGKRLMDKVRSHIEVMDAREDRIVARRQDTVRFIGLLTAGSTTAAVVLLCLVGFAAMREVRRRSQLERFLPGEIAPRLAEGDRSLREGREVPAAIAFVDMRNSTALAEALPPTELSALLSAFRRAISAAARETDGLVDKFMGDGALVVFGALDEDPAACRKAIAFARSLQQNLAKPLAGHRTPVEFGIGIHYGRVFSGIVGDDDRLEFTVLGDAVNVASRLETLTKTVSTGLVVSEVVLQEAGEPMDAWHQFRDEPLRGRHQPIAVYAERPAVLPALPRTNVA